MLSSIKGQSDMNIESFRSYGQLQSLDYSVWTKFIKVLEEQRSSYGMEIVGFWSSGGWYGEV